MMFKKWNVSGDRISFENVDDYNIIEKANLFEVFTDEGDHVFYPMKNIIEILIEGEEN